MILITRPKKQALDLKKKIDSLGYESIVSPLSYFRSLSFNLEAPKNKIILISSPRATNILLNSKQIPKTTYLLIIGNSSFQKFDQAGFKNIIHVTKNSDEMCNYINNGLKKILRKNIFSQILHLTGTVSNNNFIEKVKHIKVRKIIIYETKFIRSLDLSVCNYIIQKKIKICLVYSQANANYLIQLFKKHHLEKHTKKIIFLSLSKNIAQIFTDAGFKNSLYADMPTQKSLLTKLSKI